MNQKKIFRALQAARFTALVALIALGVLLTASGAKADGCANLSKAGTATAAPFVLPRHSHDQPPAEEA